MESNKSYRLTLTVHVDRMRSEVEARKSVEDFVSNYWRTTSVKVDAVEEVKEGES